MDGISLTQNTATAANKLRPNTRSPPRIPLGSPAADDPLPLVLVSVGVADAKSADDCFESFCVVKARLALDGTPRPVPVDCWNAAVHAGAAVINDPLSSYEGAPDGTTMVVKKPC